MGEIPQVTKNLLIINVLFFAGTYVAELYNIDLTDILGLHFFLASDFRAYQLFTYMFMHGSVMHILFNMFAVWMFGRIMENAMGPKRYLFYYIVCGLGAGLIQELVQYIQYANAGYAAYDSANLGGVIVPMSDYLNRWTTVGASGSVYGILLSFGMTFPEERMFVMPIPFPIKAKYYVVGFAALELIYGMGGSGDGVAHFAHLGGMLFGLLLLLYWRRGGGRGGYGGFNDFFGNSRGNSRGGFSSWFQKTRQKHQTHIDVERGGKYGQDMDYRQRKKLEDEELDNILDKVKKYGYERLTEEEKKRLFDMSRRG